MTDIFNDFKDWYGHLMQSHWLFQSTLPYLNLFLIYCFIFFPLEKVAAVRKQRIFRKEFVTDLLFYVVSIISGGLLLSLFTVYCFKAGNAFLPESIKSWITGFYSTSNAYMNSLPTWERLLFLVLASELGYYWAHRLFHMVPFLWRFHAVHHNPTELDWLVNTRTHPIDNILTKFCSLLLPLALGLVNIGGKLDPVLVWFVLFQAFWAFVIHANIRLPFGPLGYLITTPKFHHWHHHNEAKGSLNQNYSGMLPLFDMIFGTMTLPKRFPKEYGVHDKLPSGFLELLIYPFTRPKAKKKKTNPSPLPEAQNPLKEAGEVVEIPNPAGGDKEPQ